MASFTNIDNAVTDPTIIDFANQCTIEIDEFAVQANSDDVPQLKDEDDKACTSEEDVDSTNDADAEEREYIPGTFEGPEKTIEVWFRPNTGHPEGLRALSREKLDVLCTKAKCSILSKISSNYLDAYVLSESSLFIYKYKYIMKTCGTTTLLRCLGTLLHYADGLGMELIWVGYSRKNLNNPDAQLWPHSSFDDEIRFLSSHEKLQQRLKGSGYILGPVTSDHWFVYCADHSEIPTSLVVPEWNGDVTINMMMSNMDQSVAQMFYKENTETAREMTVKSGIADLCPGYIIDDTAFSPCGYSMNAIIHETYSTIHITPEEACSYASYETNAFYPSYLPVVRNVLNVFKPKKFVLTVFGDEYALKKLEDPTESRLIASGAAGVFVRTAQSTCKVDGNLICTMGVYTLDASTSGLKKVRSTSFVDGFSPTTSGKETHVAGGSGRGKGKY